MRKIRLMLDALHVETFDTTGGGVRPAGTVHGHAYTWDYRCEEPPPEDSINICPVPTAQATCQGPTCYYTCGYTCGCGGTQTQGGWTCTCSEPEPPTLDINVCP